MRDEAGLAATEYAVMLALIIIVCISAAKTIGNMAARNYNLVGVHLRPGPSP